MMITKYKIPFYTKTLTYLYFHQIKKMLYLIQTQMLTRKSILLVSFNKMESEKDLCLSRFCRLSKVINILMFRLQNQKMIKILKCVKKLEKNIKNKNFNQKKWKSNRKI